MITNKIKGCNTKELNSLLLILKRMELLHLIRKKRPKSIYELAQLSGRNFKNVHGDFQILKEYGLIKIARSVQKKKSTAFGLSVPYRDINIHAWI